MNRMTWVDNLRGLSILAVIFMHCMIAMNDAPNHFRGGSDLINTLLLPMRMGLMFFVSGLFVESGLRKGFAVFFQNKVLNILYPFMVWVIIFCGMTLVYSPFSNTPHTPLEIFMPHLSGGGDITWFLHTLFLFFMIILLVRNVPFYLVVMTCVFLSWAIPEIPADGIFSSFDNAHVNKSIYLFIFFYLGDYLVRSKVDIPVLCQKQNVLALSLGAFIVLTGLNFYMQEKIYYAFLAPLALLSMPVFIYIAIKINLKSVYFVGTHSIVFYLTHYLVIRVMMKVKMPGNSLLLNDLKYILTFFLALALPLVVCRLRERGKLNFLFTAKRPAKVPAMG